MITTWQIFDTKRTAATGLITKIVYGCTVQAENGIERQIGEIEITGDTASPGFISYNELTQDAIVGWVKSSLGEQEVLAIETELENKVIDYQQARQAETEKNGLPWL